MKNIPEREFNYADADFARVKAIIYRKAGINLGDSKKQLVYSRLARRLRVLQLDNFDEYLAYLDHNKNEQQEFINALTTNLTAFFREAHHFSTLADYARNRKATAGKLRVWCAASSTGEEPYSIAMTLVEAYGSYSPPVEIIASDIDSSVLEFAAQGIYSLDRLDVLSLEQKKHFFLRGKGRNNGSAKVIDKLRQLVDFRQINLLDRDWRLGAGFDVIFCRNVMIYFDKPTQLQLLERMVRLLKPEGLYIAGHSESFSNASHLVKLVAKTTYKLIDNHAGERQ
ncbi:CheR family methyltransferase [Cellvibrio fibrivorans]|uniref:Chemotaxis protein methyltransferase n=1 Tax=Cellvibrio fibrivorans TaxID=126350 RepID=A0ABU1V034_9GAMM|nr:CheR family methyltransferase [Cellvibrio fibrivorans]MDR7090770.1 chemotaxis protein methyltransferase CheR [Cellvibrio fibrivorans]